MSSLLLRGARTISLRSFPSSRGSISGHSPCTILFKSTFPCFNSHFSSSSFPPAHPNTEKEDQKRLDIAIVGAPNAGKSQLLNCITKSSIAAVSRKRHTTRNEVLGIRTISDTQLVFVDTPGYLRLRSAKEENLLRNLIVTANVEMDNADYTLLVIDAAKNLDAPLQEALIALILRALYATRTGKFGVVLNKVDLVKPKSKLLDIAAEIGSMAVACIQFDEEDTEIAGVSLKNMKDIRSKVRERKEENEDGDEQLSLEEYYPDIFYVSALQDDGVDDIIRHLLQLAPQEEWIYESHETSQLSPIERVEEIIREKIYRSVHKEVPHAVHQVNRVFEVYTRKSQETGQTTERIIRIDQDLVVKTESHKRILKGSGGKILQRIQQQAQRDIEKLFQCRVALHLHVKKTESRHDRDLRAEPLTVELPDY